MTISNQSLFKPADSIVRPWVKCALDGFPGSGKSTTAALITAGVHKAFGVNGPIYILDNERSSKFLLPLFAKEGLNAEVVESDSLDSHGRSHKRSRIGRRHPSHRFTDQRF